jgi:mannose/fructose/N-acetylgalactosamine-specific phosphotransferase system component IID
MILKRERVFKIDFYYLVKKKQKIMKMIIIEKNRKLDNIMNESLTFFFTFRYYFYINFKKKNYSIIIIIEKNIKDGICLLLIN